MSYKKQFFSFFFHKCGNAVLNKIATALAMEVSLQCNSFVSFRALAGPSFWNNKSNFLEKLLLASE